MIKRTAPKAWEQQTIDFDAPIALPEPVRRTYGDLGYEMYMGIDPGGGCGLAILGYQPETADVTRIGVGTYTHSDLVVMLRHNLSGVRAVGLEEYVNYTVTPGASAGSNNPTSQTIGAVDLMCGQAGIPCHMQPPSIKKAAWEWAKNKWSGLDMSYNTMHEKDAITHAVWRIRHRIYDDLDTKKRKK